MWSHKKYKGMYEGTYTNIIVKGKKERIFSLFLLGQLRAPVETYNSWQAAKRSGWIKNVA